MQRLFCALYFPTTDVHGLSRTFSVSVRVHPWLFFLHGRTRTLTDYFFPCQSVSIRVCFFPRTLTDSHGLFFSVSVRVHPCLFFSTDEHGLSRTIFFRVSPFPSVVIFLPRTLTDSHGLSFRVSPCPSVFVFFHGRTRTLTDYFFPCQSVFIRGCFSHGRTRTLTDFISVSVRVHPWLKKSRCHQEVDTGLRHSSATS